MTIRDNITYKKIIIDVYDIYPYSIKNLNYVKELIYYCTMAAEKFNELL